MIRKLAIVVLLLGVVGIVMGATFIGQGVAKNNLLKEALQIEQITLGIETEALAKGEIIDTAEEAQVAGDTIREHRHGIAPTYGDLLTGERFDPTDPKQLTYAQALNLENYLYLAVLSFGLITVTIAAGGFMIATGIALGVTGVVLFQLPRRTS